MHAKRVYKDFKINNLGEYHEFYIQNYTYCQLMYLRTFEMCLQIYELDPVLFFNANRLVQKTALKKVEAKLDFLTEVDMLLMVEKVIRGGKCHAIYQYAKANNKYMKNYDKK